MVGFGDLMMQENGGIWFYKMEVPKGWEGVLIEKIKFFFQVVRVHFPCVIFLVLCIVGEECPTIDFQYFALE
jgi:hypothetical protein